LALGWLGRGPRGMEKEEEEDEPPPDRMRKKETAVTPMSEFTFAQTLHFLLSTF